MKIYLAGPMRGRPYFNFPLFVSAGSNLTSWGHEVFNPAEHDIAKHGDQVWTAAPNGTFEELAEAGIEFDLRSSLGADLAYICTEAEAVVVLPGWQESSGAKAEVATALALGLPVYTYHQYALRRIDPHISITGSKLL